VFQFITIPFASLNIEQKQIAIVFSDYVFLNEMENDEISNVFVLSYLHNRNMKPGLFANYMQSRR
jgi:hypothetical protein